MQEHELKTWPSYYAALEDGSKTFEYRVADRPFRVGDTLHLREWEPLVWEGGRPTTGQYTGRAMRRLVTYTLWMGTGYVVMALGLPQSVDAVDPVGERVTE